MHISQIKTSFLLAILFMLVETSSGIAATYIQKYIIDEVFLGGHYDMLLRLLLLFAGCFLIYSAFLTITPYRYVTNEYRMDSLLLHKMLHRFFKIPMSQIQNERTARYVQYMTSDLNVGGSLVGFHTPVGVARLLQMAVLMGIVGWHSPMILLSVTLISSLYIGGGYVFAKRMKEINRIVQERRTALAVHIEESISSKREVIAYNRTVWEMKVYQSLYKDYMDSAIKETQSLNKQMLFSSPLQWAVTLSVLGFGGYKLFTGEMTLGAFVIIYQFTFQLMDAFHRVFRYVVDVTAKLVHVDRIKMLTEEAQIEDGPLGLEGPIQKLVFQDITFQYETQDKKVLDRLSLDIPIGSKVAFVGTSGGGKSTLVQLLMRFYEPTEGAVYVNGDKLSTIRREDWAKRVRVVFQDPYMMADTVRNNLLFGRENVSEASIEEACRMAQFHEDVLLLPKGYEEEVGERGVQLSGGQKQRLALARAILEDPELLILDEATSSLDLETERRLQARLDHVRAGKTTLIIAHRLSTIVNADLIYVMDGGQIAEAGTHEQLMATGRLYPKLVLAEHEKSA